MTDAARSAKRWGWAILLITGGISLTFNIAHALHGVGAVWWEQLLAVLYGVSPVLVALMLSHLMGIQRGGRFKRIVTMAVFITAMALSISAVGEMLRPTAGDLAYAYAVMLDVASLMGLHTVLTAESHTDTGDDAVPDRTAVPPAVPVPSAASVRTEQVRTEEHARTDQARTGEVYGSVDQPRTEQVRTAPKISGAGRTDGEDLGQARTAESPRRPVGAAPRVKARRTTEPYGAERQRRTAQVTRLIDRTEFVTHLADNIRTVQKAGGTWRPNYRALEKATGRKRSWCEKAVRDARTAAAEERELVMEGAHG